LQDVQAAQAYTLGLTFERDAQEAAMTRNAWSVHFRRSAPTHSQAIIIISVLWASITGICQRPPGSSRSSCITQMEMEQKSMDSTSMTRTQTYHLATRHSSSVMVSIEFTRENQRQCSATSSCRHDLMADAPAPTYAWMHLDRNSATDSHQPTLTSSCARSLLLRLLHILRWPH
jgi:hypothetical protein